MTGSAALYQVAVALIPALLFGGATLQLRQESPSLGGNKVAGAIVSLIILAGVFAEIVAIRGAIDPNLRDFEQRYLVLVLTLGTAGVAFWIAAPLLTREASGESDGAGEVRRHPDAVPRGVLAALLIAVGFFGQIAITDSLHSSAARAQFDEVAKQRVRIEHEMRAAEGNDSDSRAHLIALARSTNAAAPVVHIVLARLARLDGKAFERRPRERHRRGKRRTANERSLSGAHQYRQKPQTKLQASGRRSRSRRTRTAAAGREASDLSHTHGDDRGRERHDFPRAPRERLRIGGAQQLQARDREAHHGSSHHGSSRR